MTLPLKHGDYWLPTGVLPMTPYADDFTPGAAIEKPSLSGNYRCEPQPMSCRSGQAFSISQSGNALQLKSDKGEQGNGRLTSATTVSAGPPWNMLGVLYDGAIEWSNGTKWRKQ